MLAGIRALPSRRSTSGRSGFFKSGKEHGIWTSGHSIANDLARELAAAVALVQQLQTEQEAMKDTKMLMMLISDQPAYAVCRCGNWLAHHNLETGKCPVPNPESFFRFYEFMRELPGRERPHPAAALLPRWQEEETASESVAREPLKAGSDGQDLPQSDNEVIPIAVDELEWFIGRAKLLILRRQATGEPSPTNAVDPVPRLVAPQPPRDKGI